MNTLNRALQNIVSVCQSSKEINHRTLRILDIAYEGLGMPANQRENNINALRIASIERQRQQSARN